MKKLTAGIFATILAVVGISAANADQEQNYIASKKYVDQQDNFREWKLEKGSDNVYLETTMNGDVGTTKIRVDVPNTSGFANAAEHLNESTTPKVVTYNDQGIVTGGYSLTGIDGVTVETVGSDVTIRAPDTNTTYTGSSNININEDNVISAVGLIPTPQAACGETDGCVLKAVPNGTEGLTLIWEPIQY